MVIGIVPNSSRAESLLNNLSEADFDLDRVSVIMRDIKTRNAIARDAGPLKGVGVSALPDQLGRLGLSKTEVKTVTEAVSKDQVLVAIESSPKAEPTVAEMLKDVEAKSIKVVRK